MLESYRQRNVVRIGSLPMVLGSALALMCGLFSGCSPSQSDEWILIETESKRLYIPGSNVLFISSTEK